MPQLLSQGARQKQCRHVLPGDRVLIFDALTAMNVWIFVDEVLISNGRTKVRSGNFDFYFDEGLIIAHRRGGGVR